VKAGRRVLVLPTGGANLASIVDAFERLGARCEVSAAAGAYRRAEILVLPGVGAAPEARRRLDAAGLAARLREERRPVFGVCLGLQMLFEASAEGEVAGLGVLAGRVERLRAAPDRAVPHTGWSRVRALRAARPSRLLDGLPDGGWFYFVHSYAAGVQRDTVAVAEHGAPFAAVVERPPFYGTQFHPERSAAAGAALLARVLELEPCA
jgi:glutamine amidotransferase